MLASDDPTGRITPTVRASTTVGTGELTFSDGGRMVMGYLTKE
jgi:hypothetical protein